MKLDDILIQLGEFGLYQKYLYSMICWTSVYCGIYALMSVIFLNTPDHRCKIPGLQNDTYGIYNAYHENLVNNYIPPPSDDATDDYDRCHLYSFDYNDVMFDNSGRPINASLVECTDWVYSDSVFKETFTSKFNIVCGEKHLTSFIKSLFFAGKLVGAIVFGNLSDAFGRKTAFYIALVSMFGLTFGMSWSSSYIVFGVILTAIGATTQGVFPVGFVLGVELVGPSKRQYAGIVIDFFFSLGLMFLAGVSYFARHWFYISIICSAPAALFILYWWLIPESPRWLISKQKYEEANTVLQKAAKINKVVIEKNLFEKEIENRKTEPVGRIWQLFSTWVMLLRTLVIMFNWCIVSMMYYGLSLNAGNLGGDFYLNMFLSGLVEIPANAMALLLVDRIGRQKVYCLSMLLGGCACASTIIPILIDEIENQAIITALAMIGKFGATAAFSTIYFFSAELFPTVVRNAGMGASSCAGRIGGIVAPYIADSVRGMVGKVFPLGIFGLLAITAGLSSLYLPETLNKPLPETIEDGKRFGKCKIPGLENDTYDIQNANHQDLVNSYIPPPSGDGTHEYDQCHLYSIDYNDVKFDNSSRPIYASLFNIVCSDTHLIPLVKSLYIVGKFIGAVLFGNLSDAIGRKTTYCVALMSMFGLTFVMSWSSSYIMYAVILTAVGAVAQGIIPVGMVLSKMSSEIL
ncbi:organic cation transporter protein-like [Pecten maximus]|uniref:organic cation transporter protein-like n=1 Tax=Pecten maximus TaxID=6579 RepID=UPI001459082A|nr:organic cation transporter protein-like [Pecten maximus]